MITNFKIFESINKPQIGDYLYADIKDNFTFQTEDEYLANKYNI